MPSSPNAAELPPTVVTVGWCNDGVVILSRENGRRDDCNLGKCGCNGCHHRLVALHDKLSPGKGHPSRMWMDPKLKVCKRNYTIHKMFVCIQNLNR